MDVLISYAIVGFFVALGIWLRVDEVRAAKRRLHLDPETRNYFASGATAAYPGIRGATGYTGDVGLPGAALGCGDGGGCGGDGGVG